MERSRLTLDADAVLMSCWMPAERTDVASSSTGGAVDVGAGTL